MEEKECIIISVDDDDVINQINRDYLSMSGYTVKTFTDPSEALTFLSQCQCAVIITDINMPDINGIHFAKKCREIDPDIPIIFMTAYQESSTAIHAVKLQAVDFIKKPLMNLNDLSRAVDKAVENRLHKT